MMQKLFKNLFLFIMVVLFDYEHQSMSQNQIMQPTFNPAQAKPFKKSTRKRRDLPINIQSEWYFIPRVYESSQLPDSHILVARTQHDANPVASVTSSHVPYPFSSYPDANRSYSLARSKEPYYLPDYGYNQDPLAKKNASSSTAPVQDNTFQGVSVQPVKNKELFTDAVDQTFAVPEQSLKNSAKNFDTSHNYKTTHTPVCKPTITVSIASAISSQSTNSLLPVAILGLPLLNVLKSEEAVDVEPDIEIESKMYELPVALDSAISQNISEQVVAFQMPEAKNMQSESIEPSAANSLPTIAQSNLGNGEMIRSENVLDSTVEPVEVAASIESNAEQQATHVAPMKKPGKMLHQLLTPAYLNALTHDTTRLIAQEATKRLGSFDQSQFQKMLVAQGAPKGMLQRIVAYGAHLKQNPLRALTIALSAAAIALPVINSSSAQLPDTGVDWAIQDFIAQKGSALGDSLTTHNASLVANTSIGATLTTAIAQIASSATSVKLIP